MGKLIVFEGIDGSGKSTQFKLLCDRFRAEGRDFKKLAFPQYSEPHSVLLRMYLAGEFGQDPEAVNAYAASSFFAVDRYASYIKSWGEYYNRGDLLMCDRYTTSNAIHQGAKLPEWEREKFLKWLYEYEFDLLELPAPAAVLYMDIPAAMALEQMRRRERETDTTGDIHETDTEYLFKCAECGRMAADYYGWTKIKCEEGGKMRSIEDIGEEIYAIVTGVV